MLIKQEVIKSGNRLLKPFACSIQNTLQEKSRSESNLSMKTCIIFSELAGMTYLSAAETLLALTIVYLIRISFPLK